MKYKRCALILGLILIGIILIHLSSAQIIVDSEVEELLKTQNEVDVIVILKADNIVSDYSSSIHNPEERTNWIEDITKQVDEVQDKVIPFLSEDDFKVEHKFHSSPDFSGWITQKGLNKLIENPNVIRIVKNAVIYGTLHSSIPLINATGGWDLGYSGEGMTVCVIDSGVDYTHPALGGCLGNGCKIKAGTDYVDGDSDPLDENLHGTHVAGIVASNDSTYKGVAPNASLIAVKCEEN